MKLRHLGNSGLDVSRLCLGGNVFGWTIDKKKSFEVLDAYVEGGGNFIDTADVYSRWAEGNIGGESETIIGEWMKERKNRNKIVIATKLGMEMGPHKSGLKKDYMVSAVEASLKRLQTDRIDLYIAHQDDESTPLEETLEMFGHLIEHGKIRVAGASNYTGKRLRHAIEDVSHKKGLPAYQTLQPHYNLYDRKDYEMNILNVCQEWNLGVTPYFSLASGFLTGKYRSPADFSKSPRGARGMDKYLNERGLRILQALDSLARMKKTTPAAIALAWLMHQPTITAPIASATSTEQMKDLLAAMSLDMQGVELELLDQASRY